MKRVAHKALRHCQSKRPNENITEWINFFFDALRNIQKQLLNKLELRKRENQLSSRENAIIMFIGNHPGCKSGEIAKKLDIPSPTVKRIIPNLIAMNLIEKHGKGPGTNYSLK
ncbi:MAG: hypothetical protein DRR16_18430 [Candidatus Parabeggiatoa sp. nov. 3]|nr:MAG: hypothetical protein DRR00_22950 [Gammaproteobacteria bacterium]RKZ61681.1 MAG: hypothetical protein DRQ99_20025 [Gammaproteobacteria bacterium]RKZ82999.1 MAG: hypothetical protein DRR16_18430 [Gammaproteobacteria bacterium]HEW98691.1 MarR family transcriptional regulator [Beggiatoa sp.]